MPEIKHQFTGGRMNKDLDERLVPNGEYKDAMNIQVSTSENSDVGTIQNILGNSLVPGQNFISEQSFCVGSIADEKNDKLYYFISTSEEIISSPNLDSTENWGVHNPGSVQVGSGLHGFDDDGGYSLLSYPANLEHGVEYRIVIKVVSKSSDVAILHNDGVTQPVLVPYGSGPGTYEATFTADTTENITGLMLFHTPYSGENHHATISYVSLKRATQKNYIIEYDSRSNKITPVLVDLSGSVLKFDADRLITGVNIIDDMLFWTDNYSEPKKINITRSIQGTDSSGLIHTQFINEEQDLSLDIREEHITVIKKSPKFAPSIELLSERNSENVYAGVMRVSNGEGGPGDSSLRNPGDLTLPWSISPDGGPSNFSNLGVGNKFYTFIETDINGDSGFTLDWGVGDIVVFKEFEIDQNGVEVAPSIPITDYTIKARIINDNNQNAFNDESQQVSKNSSFEIPDESGIKAKFWLDSGGGDFYPYYDYANNSIVYDGTGGTAWGTIRQNITWALDATYRVTLKISAFNGVIEGRFRVDAIAPLSFGSSTSATDEAHAWTSPWYDQEGTYTWEFTTAYDSGATVGYWGNGHHQLYFQTDHPDDYQHKVVVEYINVERLDVQNAGVELEILDISGYPPTPQGSNSTLRYAVDKLNEEEKLFEFKFPRFAYRYQYQDKEYSNISPFSPIAFLPGSFDYHPKKGYNLGMTNKIDRINIKDFVQNVPNGVVAIDILYKEEVSPNIYVVDTIKPKHSELQEGGSIWNNDLYVVQSEILKQALPSNQILRPWDAVPRKALAQDITGNRIVYGNYIQNYDLKYNDQDYYPDFSFSIKSKDTGLTTVKSIKSLREYQLGVVFIDEYGRETPVATNTSGFSNVLKSQSNQQNKAVVKFNNTKFPSNMKYFKFFIKETSGEYYNMAMDRWYDAEDGHVWLSFPSSDRNKIDIDSFLILKKGVDSNSLIQETARYKILAIENEAPDFIKTTKSLIEEKTHDFSAASAVKNIFGNDVNTAPLSGRSEFKMNYRPFYDSSGSDLHNIKKGDLYVEFGTNDGDYISNDYRIASITTDLDVDGAVPVAEASYSIRLVKPLGKDVDHIVDNVTSPSFIVNDSTVRILQYTVENSPQFDGRFFVKIANDNTFSANVSINSFTGDEFRTVTTRKLYYMSSNHIELHSDVYTGLTAGKYANDAMQTTTTDTLGQDAQGEYWPAGETHGDEWLPGDGTQVAEPNHFGRFAPFFRNYKHTNSEFSVFGVFNNAGTHIGDSPTGGADAVAEEVNVGRYAFGDVFEDNRSDQPWKAELSYYVARTEFRVKANIGTDQNNLGGPISWTGTWQYDHYDGPRTIQGLKIADNHGWNESERAGIFNGDGEQTHGAVWFIDNGPFVGSSDGNTLNWRYIAQNGTPNNPHYSTGFNASGGKIEFGLNVYDDHVASQQEWNTANFWDIGADGGNTFHDNSETKQLVDKIQSGQKWRWKEDPSGEVYTFMPSSSINKRLLRYDNDRTPYMVEGYSPGHDPYSSYPDNQYYATAITASMAGGSVGSFWGAPYDRKQFDALGQLSPNFSKNWKMEFENSTGTSTASWDPTMNDNPGPITNGLHLSVNATSDPCHDGGFSIINPYIRVDNIHNIADVNTGLTYSLEPGMIMVSHSNADSGGTLDGSAGKEYLIISKIVESPFANIPAQVYFTGYQKILTDENFPTSGTTLITAHSIFSDSPAASQALVFRQPAMNGYSQYSVNRINQEDAVGKGWSINNPGILAVGYTMEFIEQVFRAPEMPNNPAIWETEPKDTADLAIYYEASGYNPLVLTEETKHIAIPLSSKVINPNNINSIPSGSAIQLVGFTSVDFSDLVTSGGVATGWYVSIKNDVGITPFVGDVYINPGSKLEITKPDGSVITVTVKGWGGSGTPNLVLYIDEQLYGGDTEYVLNWHNCYSFGNGVESNRIRDNFNLPFILNGVKVSTVLEGGYKEEHRKYGLIYSGIYNSTSGINNLNQFIMAEKITKEVNPIYGSIQKLHSRDTDLVTLCEDKILKILANKDAVFNADGNAQLTATENVLGQTVPFIGEYGISTNPESFASEAYRAYFTDRVRGAVMRLSRDGLTPISEHGMKDWFRDNLSLGRTNVLGENALNSEDNWDIPNEGNSAIVNGEAVLGYYNNDVNDFRYGKVAKLVMNDVLEIGKTYRIQYDVVEHSGLKHQDGSNRPITVVNMFPGSGWIAGAYGGVASQTDGGHVNETWVANTTDFELLQYQVNNPARHYTPPGGITYPITGFDDGGTPNDDTDDTMYGSVRDYVHAQRIANGAIDSNEDGVPDDAVEENVANVNLTTSNDGFQIIDNNTVSWDGLSVNNVNYIKNITSSADMEVGATYYITLTVSNYSGTDMMGFSTNANVPFNMRLNGNGTVSNYFVSTGARPDLFATDTNAGTMEVSIQKVISSNIYPNYSWFYASIVRIKNLIVEEVKQEDLKIIGSYDDRQDEYNVTIHGTDSNTVSFKEDVKGWVSFKSFIPENAVSCANDYYTMKQGKLWQHHNPGINRNTFYNEFTNSSFKAVLNDIPSSIKSYHTLEYEGSQSRIEGIKRVEVTGIQHAQGPANDGKYFFFEVLDVDALLGYSNWASIPVEVKQYRNNVLIRTDLAIMFGNVGNSLFPASPSGGPTKGHGRWDSGNSPGDWEVGDIITTQIQEDSIHAIGSDLFNSTPADGWYVSGVETNKEKGSLPEFIEKEGKWFNYIKGVDQAIFNEQIEDYSHLDFGSFEIQGLGMVEKINGNAIAINGDLNASLQVGDIVYHEITSLEFGSTTLDSSKLQRTGVITDINKNIITVDNSGTVPQLSDYCMFVKNQVINMNGLSGYYADVMFENNSKEKAELFSVSSEITESSK